MQVLGIYDGTHDAGAALLRDGDLVAACNEERFSRVKGAGGWPSASIAYCLRMAGGVVDRVAFAGVVNPNPGLRGVRRLQRSFRLDDGAFYVEAPTRGDRIGQWLQFRSPFPYLRAEHPASALIRPAVRGMLGRSARRAGIDAPAELYEHHRCHAASAWYTSGFGAGADIQEDRKISEGLVVVADGIGDGLALTVWRGGPGGLTRLGAMPYPHSYGLLYATMTGFLGFRPFRHEGKLTGLAALGDAAAVREPFPFHGPVEDRRFTQRFGAELRPWLDRLRGYRREDVCAWLQAGLEQELGALCAWWMAREGLTRLALAGGVFANVRLNQAIGALPGVEALSVHPHMGDGGLAAGAALSAWAEAEPGARPRTMRHAFLGPSWGEEEIGAALAEAGLPRRRPQDIEEQAARLLAEDKIVARFDGAMEYGPRALGNRSILAAATDARMTDRLNLALSRSDFMPFAPLLLDEEAEGWVEGLAPVREAARFMTVTVQAGERLRRACPAAIHVDGSLRPQLVDAATHPGLHRILRGYYRRTGVPALINTSYNLHEEPIVCRPQEAIATWRAARIDALAIGPFLVSQP